MKRLVLVLAALALLGFATNAVSAAEPLDVKSDGALLQTAVLHAHNGAQLDTVGWRHGGGWGWGGWYGGGYWPYYAYSGYAGYPYYSGYSGGYWGGSYPYWGGYWSYPYYSGSWYPYGGGCCCY